MRFLKGMSDAWHKIVGSVPTLAPKKGTTKADLATAKRGLGGHPYAAQRSASIPRTAVHSSVHDDGCALQRAADVAEEAILRRVVRHDDFTNYGASSYSSSDSSDSSSSSSSNSSSSSYD